MQHYRVELTASAKRQLRNILEYIYYNLRNEQAYQSVKEDFIKTFERLEFSAGLIADSEDDILRKLNLKKMHFISHKYVLLFKVVEDVAYVVEIHHESEDYINNRV